MGGHLQSMRPNLSSMMSRNKYIQVIHLEVVLYGSNGSLFIYILYIHILHITSTRYYHTLRYDCSTTNQAMSLQMANWAWKKKHITTGLDNHRDACKYHQFILDRAHQSLPR